MKDFGAELLEQIPVHWSVRRLRNVAEMRVSNVDKHIREGEQPVRLCNYVDVYKNNRIHRGIGFMSATATVREIQRFRLRAGDVLITKDSEDWTDIAVPALVDDADDDVVCGYRLALLRPHADRIHGAFLFRALQSQAVAPQFRVLAPGVTRYGLSHAVIKSVWLPVPPLPELAATARFLDHATGRIDRYIRAKEKLIGHAERRAGLLSECRTRLIANVLTGKLAVRHASERFSNVSRI